MYGFVLLLRGGGRYRIARLLLFGFLVVVSGRSRKVCFASAMWVGVVLVGIDGGMMGE